VLYTGGAHADEYGAVGLDQALERQFLTVDAGLPEAGQPLVGVDLDEGVIAFRALLVMDKEGLDVCDLHEASLFAPTGRHRAWPPVARPFHWAPGRAGLLVSPNAVVGPPPANRLSVSTTGGRGSFRTRSATAGGRKPLSSPLVNKALSEEELQSYNERGYLLYRRQLFEPAQLEALEEIFLEHRAAEMGKRGDEFDTPHFDDKRLLEFLLAPSVLDLVECIVGPNIVLWSSHFICKDPLVGRATPWHEDSAYWSGRLGRYDRVVTVWLALDDVDRANGCMQVIPGSHLEGGFSSYREVDASANTFQAEIAGADLAGAVALELRRGECSLHDGRIKHGAEANRSSRRRLGYTMRYLPAEVKVLPEKNVGHLLWLARGRPVAPNKYENV